MLYSRYFCPPVATLRSDARCLYNFNGSINQSRYTSDSICLPGPQEDSIQIILPKARMSESFTAHLANKCASPSTWEIPSYKYIAECLAEFPGTHQPFRHTQNPYTVRGTWNCLSHSRCLLFFLSILSSYHCPHLNIPSMTGAQFHNFRARKSVNSGYFWVFRHHDRQ